MFYSGSERAFRADVLYGSDKRAAFAFFFFLPRFCTTRAAYAAIASRMTWAEPGPRHEDLLGFVFGRWRGHRTVA